MTVGISVKLEDDLSRDLDREVAGGNRSAFVAEAIRDALDRRRVAAAARWHASLAGEDAAALAAFDAEFADPAAFGNRLARASPTLMSQVGSGLRRLLGL
jgi:Arc/MetJ-type ribon-helix-helix transcriptional regulator